MTILSRMGQEVEVSVNVHPRPMHSAEPEPPCTAFVG